MPKKSVEKKKTIEKSIDILAVDDEEEIDIPTPKETKIEVKPTKKPLSQKKLDHLKRMREIKEQKRLEAGGGEYKSKTKRLIEEEEKKTKTLEKILERLDKLEMNKIEPKIIKKPVYAEERNEELPKKEDEPENEPMEIIKEEPKPKMKSKYFELLEKRQKK